VRDRDAAIVPRRCAKLTVNGSPAFRIPAGATVLTDAVDLQVPARTDLAVDVFVPDDLGGGPSLINLPQRRQSDQLRVAARQSCGETVMTGASSRAVVLLSRVECGARAGAGAVAAFAIRSPTARGRRRHQQPVAGPPRAPARTTFAVMNVAIAGNRVLTEGNAPGGFGGNAGINAFARFDRDVLAQPGSRTSW